MFLQKVNFNVLATIPEDFMILKNLFDNHKVNKDAQLLKKFEKNKQQITKLQRKEVEIQNIHFSHFQEKNGIFFSPCFLGLPN